MQTTIHIAASIGIPSTATDHAGAVDYSVTLTYGDVELDADVTLIPSQFDGRLGQWGAIDNWASCAIVRLANDLSRQDCATLCAAIVSACLDGTQEDECEIDFPTHYVGRDESGQLVTADDAV